MGGPPSPPQYGPGPRRPVPWAYQVRTVPAVRAPYEKGLPARRWRRLSDRLGHCLLYPLVDGPGIGLLVFMPPLLMWMSIPALDVVAILAPRGEFNALALLIVPFTLPLDVSFALTLGYVLLFFGQVLVSSALGEDDHPRWPQWDSHRIAEGLGRWLWAALVGLVAGGLPALLYWGRRGHIDIGPIDAILFGELAILGVGYAQMILAAALLHDSLSAAQPVAAVQAIARIGWPYLRPCLVSSAALAVAAGGLYSVLFHSPSIRSAAVGLWLFWLYSLYAAMVCLRVLGLTYYAYADRLGWYRTRPRWATTTRTGQIYANS